MNAPRMRVFPPSSVEHVWRSTFATLVLMIYAMVAGYLLFVFVLPWLAGFVPWSAWNAPPFGGPVLA